MNAPGYFAPQESEPTPEYACPDGLRPRTGSTLLGNQLRA